MQDQTLIKTALVVMISGLIVLAAWSALTTPQAQQEGVFAPKEQLMLTGRLEQIQIRGEVTRAMLDTCMKVPLVLFDPVPLEQDRIVEVQGRREIYQGELQVVVDSLQTR